MKKNNKSNKYIDVEIFVKHIFEKLGKVDSNYETLMIQQKNYVPDLIVEFDGKKYCIEIKIKFSSNIFGKILEDFYEFIISENISGILVVLDKVPGEYKKMVKEKYDIIIYDISNILYLIYDDENLQRDLNGLIGFSLDNVIPEETSIKLDSNKIKYKGKYERKNYIEELNRLEEGRNKSKKYEVLLEKII